MSRSLCFFLKVVVVFTLMLETAGAAQWREVGSVPDSDASVYVDDASISVDHDIIVKGWVRFDYDKPRERDGYKLTSYVSHRMVDCAANRYWLMDGWGSRSEGGEQVRIYSSFQEWQMPPPDSEAEVASAALCNEAQSFFGGAWNKLQIMNRLQLVWKIIRSAVM